jgi:protoporphyrinogen oxidase
VKRKAIIIGAGPAGLTAAYELLRETDIVPVVLEQDSQPGGLSKTVFYHGNGIDIGGHRFFSKSERVMDWWRAMLPVEETAADHDPREADAVMLARTRQSRILFGGRLFDYPVALSFDTARKLGPVRMARIGASYLYRFFFPVRPVRNLEDFMINRFGDTLYRTFFKTYTEKVWGVPCDGISAAWGAQRIRDVSLGKALANWLKRFWRRGGDMAQQAVPTSMIERFLYPKYGPGQMWEKTAAEIRENGGELLYNHRVTGVVIENSRITAVEAVDARGRQQRFEGDVFISTMPVRDLVTAMGGCAPEPVRDAAAGLAYRDFITAGLLVSNIDPGIRKYGESLKRDNWLYIQEPAVRIGRLQFYNNWSPWLIRDPEKCWMGLEYFCAKGDDLWLLSDDALLRLAATELEKIGIINAADVEDGVVLRVEKAYPAYFGSWNRFPEIRAFMDTVENLYLIGRNGMHRYNNQDHAMLTAMAAVNCIRGTCPDREPIWSVNVDEDYHEEGA